MRGVAETDRRTAEKPRRRTGRWLMAALGALTLTALVALAQQPAVAGQSHLVTFVPSGISGPDIALDFSDGLTFDDALDALGSGGEDNERTIALPIPGLDQIASIPMDLDVGPDDGSTRSLALVAAEPADFLAGHIADVRPVFVAVWDSDSDTTPDFALAFEVAGADLDQLHPVWGSVPGVAEAIRLAAGVITLVPDVAGLAELDPATLPESVRDLYGLVPGDAPLAFDDVATLLADLDLANMPGLELIATFLGADVDEITGRVEQVMSIAGSLADTAAFLFDEAQGFDPERLSLRGPIDIDTTNLPPWVLAVAGLLGIDDIPELSLRLEPLDGGVLVARADVSGQFTIGSGGTANTFDFRISLDQADGEQRKLDITLSTEQFHEPFGLEWLELQHVELTIEYVDENPGQHEFTGRFEADLPIAEPAPRLRIQLDDDPDRSRGTVTVDGAIPVPALLELLGRAPDTPDDLVDLLGFATASVRDLELTADSDGPVFGILGTVTNVGDLFEDLRIQLLLALDATQPIGASTLVAVVVDSEGCDGTECLRLEQVIPLPGGGLSVDLDLPAVRFMQIAPDGAEFAIGKLGDGAQAFLAGFLDGDGTGNETGDEANATGDGDVGIQSFSASSAGAPETISRPGGLQLLVDVPITPLAPLFEAVGITPTSSVVRVEGRAGFTLPDLTDLSLRSSIDVTELRLEARQDGFSSVPPAPDFPTWLRFPSIGEWSMFVEFQRGDPAEGTADSVALGISIDGIRFEYQPDLVTRLDVAFQGESFQAVPGGPQPTWSLSASLALAQPWVEPFGIDWLTVRDAEARLSITTADGQTNVAARLVGTFELGEAPNAVVLTLSAEISTQRARFSIKLAQDLSVSQVLAVFAPTDLVNRVPDGLASVALQADSELAVEAVFTGPAPGSSGPRPGIYVDAVVNVSFQLFGNSSVQFSALAHASLPSSGDPFAVFGMRPRDDLRLSDLLPGVSLPDEHDLVLVSESASVGFLFSFLGGSGPGVDPLSLSETATTWFDPLIVPGGDPEVRALGTGVGVLGAIKAPGPLAEFAPAIGLEDRVQLFGQIPLDGNAGALRAGLGLVANQELLPDFLERASLSFAIEIGTDGLSFEADGTLVVRSQHGVDEDLAGVLRGIGVDLEVTREVEAGFACPRGGALRRFHVPHVDTVTYPDGRPAWFCVDLLELGFTGKLTVVPGTISGTLELRFNSLNEDDTRKYGWSPLGLDVVEINQLVGQIEIGFTAPKDLFIEIGGQGSVTVLGYSVSGGVKGGVSVSLPPPPPPIVTPRFTGFWFALPQGIGTQELTDLYEAVMPTAQGTEDLRVWMHIPGVALRDIYFSLGLADEPSLCIKKGVAFTAELLAGENIEAPPEYAVLCDNGVLRPQLDPDQLPGPCPERRDVGCVARVDVELSLSGIRIEGDLAGFEVGLPDGTPLLRFDDSILIVRLTTDEQLLQINGKIQIGPGDPAWATGEVRVRATPLQLEAFGRVDVFGYGALFELRAGLGDGSFQGLLAGGFDPGASLRVVLTAPGGFGAEPDFGTLAEGAIEPLLRSIDDAGAFLEEWLGTFTTLNDIGLAELLIDLPLAAKDELGVTLDPTVGEVLRVTSEGLLPLARSVVPRTANLDVLIISDLSLGGVAVIRGLFVVVGAEDFFDEAVGDSTVLSVCTILRGVYEVFYDATPSTGSCTITEVRRWIRALSRDAVAGVSHLSGLTTQAIDQILGYAGGAVPFTIECAELNTSLSLIDGSSFAAAIRGTVFGQPYSVGLELDPRTFGFGDHLLKQVWAMVTTPGSPTTACTGIDPGLVEYLEAEATPVIGVSVLPQTVDEGGEVTVTVSFDRDLADARQVEIDWGDPTLDVPPTTLTVEAGERSATATHVYRDDVPSGRSSARYVIRATDLTEGGGTATTAVTVRNVRPRIRAVEVRDQERPFHVDEGDPFDLVVRWTDPGILDTHTVSITWGDGQVSPADTIELLDDDQWVNGIPTWEATATHTYVDDDPTGTPEDVYNVRVLVVDDDRGLRIAVQPITVVNVAPSNITVTPLLDDGQRIEEGIPVTYRIEWDDPGERDTFELVIDFCHGHPSFDEPNCGDGVVRIPADGEEPLGAQFVDVTHVYRDDDPTGTPVDAYTIHVTVTDDDTGVGTGSQQVDVHNVDPVVTVDVDELTTQYSDPFGGDPTTGDYEPVIAIIEVYDVIPDTLAMSVAFDDGELASWLTLEASGDDCIVDTDSEYHHRCSWELRQHPDPVSGIFTDIAPGTYDIVFTVTDDDEGVGAATLTLVVEPEDARVWYVGPTFAATASARVGDTTVELRATIRDITSAVPTDHPDWDPWPGDIRNADMRFVERFDDGNDIARCPGSAGAIDTVKIDEVFHPFDVFRAASNIGVGSCPWVVNLGNKDAEEYPIGTVVGSYTDSYYVRDHTEDDTVVTVAKPLDDFITGGGYLVLSDSAGVFAGAQGSNANFGFHVKFNKPKTNLQGGVTLIVRGVDGTVYRVKSNAMDSLGVDQHGRAQFEAKANITDVSDRDNPYNVGGNYVLQMTLHDRSNDGSDDTIGFSLWDERRTGNGRNATTTRLLLFSSSWDGNQTQEQTLGGGNLVVHHR